LDRFFRQALSHLASVPPSLRSFLPFLYRLGLLRAHRRPVSRGSRPSGSRSPSRPRTSYSDCMVCLARGLVVIAAVLGVACSGSGSMSSRSTDGPLCDDATATPSTDGPGFDCGPIRCSNDQECVVLSCSPAAASCVPTYGCYDLPAACNG